MSDTPIPILIKESLKAIRGSLEFAFQENGLDDLRPQDGHLLHYIADHPNCGATELQQLQCVSKSSVSFSLSLLAEKGFIEYLSSEEDRREKHIVITEKGILRNQKAKGVIADIERSFTRDMSQEEMENLRICLEKIIANAERRKENE